MKLKCPFCSHQFPPQDKNKCPECGKFINIPKKYKPGHKEEAEKKKKQTPTPGAKSSEKKRSYAQPAVNPMSAVAQNGKLVFLLFLVFGIFLFLQYGSMRDSLEEGPAEPKIDGRPLLAERDLFRIRTALELYKVSCYRYPSQKEGLRALIEDPGVVTWDGPYMTTMRPDPWEQLYRYYITDGEIELYSLGPDRKEGTADDMHAPPPMPIEEWPDHWLRENERKRAGLPPLEEKAADTNTIEDAESDDTSAADADDTPEQRAPGQKETADQSEDQSAAPEE